MDFNEIIINVAAQVVINDSRIKYLEKVINWIVENNSDIKGPNQNLCIEMMDSALEEARANFKKEYK